MSVTFCLAYGGSLEAVQEAQLDYRRSPGQGTQSQRAFLSPHVYSELCVHLAMQKSPWKSQAAVLPYPTVWPKSIICLSQARHKKARLKSLWLYVKTLKDCFGYPLRFLIKVVFR